MNKLEQHRDLLFSTLSEITSLIIAGHDNQIIIDKLLDCSLVVLDAERVYLLELSGDRVVKYSKTRNPSGPSELRIESLTGATSSAC